MIQNVEMYFPFLSSFQTYDIVVNTYTSLIVFVFYQIIEMNPFKLELSVSLYQEYRLTIAEQVVGIFWKCAVRSRYLTRLWESFENIIVGKAILKCGKMYGTS